MSRRKRKTRLRSKRSFSPKPAVQATLDIVAGNSSTRGRWERASIERMTQAVPEYDRLNLSSKARQEYLTNQWLAGIVKTLSYWTIGTGPRLQVRTKRAEINEYVESMFHRVSKRIGLAQIARAALASLAVDGESFIQFAVNPVKRGPEQIVPVAIDPKRIKTPFGMQETRYLSEGIRYDAWGNEIAYMVADTPNRPQQYYDFNEMTEIPAESMTHIFEPVISEQLRGFSWFAPSLESAGRIRDYDDAVLENAKLQSSYIGVIKPEYGIGEMRDNVHVDGFNTYESFKERPVVAGTWLQLPPKTDANAWTPSQPLSNHGDFIKTIMAGVGFGAGIPRSKATGSTNDYNFASGKLDDRGFLILMKIIRELFEVGLYDKYLEFFYNCLRTVWLEDAPDFEQLRFEWKWPTPPSIDEQKDATADDIRLKNGTLLRKTVIERDGGNYEAFLRQLELEKTVFGEYNGNGKEVLRDEPSIPEIGT